MADVWVGIIAILVGVLFCFRGTVALRAIIAIWGAFVGFWIGAGVVASLTGEALLAGPGGWIAGILVGLVVGGLAYAFYVLAVVITMGSIGYGLGLALAAALNGASDALTVVIGVTGAIVLAVLALLTNLPRLLLILVSAGAGASVTVAGAMLVTGSFDVAGGEEAVQAALSEQWWWLVLYVVLAVAGAIVQLRSPARATARSSWEGQSRAVERR